MMHSERDTLVDLAKARAGTASRTVSAASCRRQVAELRDVLTSGCAASTVPEPSPLFWEHLSERVRRDVAAGDRASPMARRRSGCRRLDRVDGVAAGVATVAIVAVAVDRVSRAGRRPRPARRRPSSSAADAVGARAAGAADDASLALVADLVAQMDAEAAVEAGLTDPGAASMRRWSRLTARRTGASCSGC